jgi:hypothetical protein
LRSVAVSAKRNHYLPQFYLEYFILPGEKCIWVYDKSGGEPRCQQPINTGVEGHLYSIINEQGEKDDSIETQFLAPLDGRVKPVLDRWGLPGAQLTSEDVPLVAEFMASLCTRVPRQIEMIREFGKVLAIKRSHDLAGEPDRLMAYLQRYQEENPGDKLPDVEEFRKLLEDPEEHFKISTNKRIAMAVSILSTHMEFEEFLTMNWLLVRVPGSVEFVTADAPVVSFVPDGQGRAMFGGGLRLPGVEVSFPLNPSTCIFLHRHGPEFGLLPNEHFLREMNKRMVYNAERFVVSRTRSPEIVNAVKRFSYTRQHPKLDRNELFPYIEQKMRELTGGCDE